MVAVGSVAPKFIIDGRSYPAPNSVLAFYKVTCPTCKLALPYLHRINRAVVGISQDSREATSAFEAEFEVQIRSFLDPADSGYTISNAYGIEYVPTLFVIDDNGNVAASYEGFNREALETLGVTFSAAEAVPIYKPG